MHYIYFSIIIPAHNEEDYIENTLKHLLNLNYPKKRLEILVVENGSTDKTLLKIKKTKYKLINIYSTKKKGISFAKNLGASKSNKDSEWLIFLDADTLLGKDFLLEINKYLTKNNSKNLAIGTTTILPIEKEKTLRFWFRIYDIIHKLFKMSCSIQIVKKNFFEIVKYDENLLWQEDLALIDSIKKYGKFFYVPTNKAKASARRFKNVGGLKLAFEWAFMRFLPYRFKLKRDYKVIR
jgi:glycosyltransferase involved in cell wall biosynthesis